MCVKFYKNSENTDVLIEFECERVFSISGHCLNIERNSLNRIKLVREIMFIYNKSLLGL